jgi:hypothetical protein
MWCPLSAKVGTNFADKQRLLGLVRLWTQATEFSFLLSELGIQQCCSKQCGTYGVPFLIHEGSR